MLKVYPWQKQPWEQLQKARDARRLPHAILLSGPQGVGLRHFSQCLAESLLCQQTGAHGAACMQCKSCVLYQAGNHPDSLVLEPEEKGKQIKVAPVRELIDYIHLSQYERYKLAVLEPAESMNKSAANSLLKTLEEPPANSLLILISYQPALLPVTIRSRCQHIKIPAASKEQARDWLQAQTSISAEELDNLLLPGRGGPLKILDFIETDLLAQQKTILDDLKALQQKRIDPVSVAEKWQGFGISDVLHCLLLFFAEMSRLKLAQSPANNNSNINRDVQGLTNGVDLGPLLMCYDTILKSYHSVTGPISLNKQSLLEQIIIQWQSLVVGGR